MFGAEKQKILFSHQISAILTDSIEKGLKITSREKNVENISYKEKISSSKTAYLVSI